MPSKLSVHEAIAVLLWRSPTNYHCNYIYRTLSSWLDCQDYIFPNERSLHPDIGLLMQVAPPQLTTFEAVSRLYAFSNLLWAYYTDKEQANIIEYILCQ